MQGIRFYHDGVKVAEVATGGPFDERQFMFFDTEVFTGHGWPTRDSLLDPTKNTMLVDWVRAWKLASNCADRLASFCRGTWDGTLYSEGFAKNNGKLLKSPDEGTARKEALFTREGNALYAICAILPDDQLILKGIKVSDSANVTLLGVGDLDWKQDGGNLVITMPKLNPSKMPCSHAWTFKVSDIEDSKS